jgi:enoyl-CoA hydratase
MSVVETHRESSVGWIIFNRPDVLNAMNEEVLDRFDSSIKRFVSDTDVRVIAISGTGRAFSTGADMDFLASANAEGHRKIMEAAHAMTASVEAAPKPVIAAVNGIAAGGGLELSLACDFVFAERRAQFGLTEIRYGFLPGGGGTQRLPRRVSWANAMHLLCSGEIISAERAAEIGLVFRLVENGQLQSAVHEFAGGFVNRSGEAIAAAKALMRRAVDEPLAAGLKAETSANLDLLKSESVGAAMAKFVRRRRQKNTSNGEASR